MGIPSLVVSQFPVSTGLKGIHTHVGMRLGASNTNFKGFWGRWLSYQANPFFHGRHGHGNDPERILSRMGISCLAKGPGFGVRLVWSLLSWADPCWMLCEEGETEAFIHVASCGSPFCLREQWPDSTQRLAG